MRRTTTILLASLGLAAGPLACGDSESEQDTSADTTPDTAPDTVPDTAPDTNDTAAPDADTTEPTLPQPCGTTSAAALAGCVESSRLTTDLNAIAGARPTGTAKNREVQDFLATRLTELGFTVTRDDYGRGVNIVGTKLGKTSPTELVVISAHHDSVPNCPGADDNGSGVVGALEAARILGQIEHDRTLVIALWDEEEIGLLGSFDWADRLARSGSKVVVSYVLEMIGYRSDEVDSQTLPAGFDVLFAEATAAVNANGNRGDFIAIIADQSAAPYTAFMDELGAATGHSTVSLHVPTTLLGTNLINDLRRSDHSPFWAYGWPAMMITDTANFRNPNYHCAAAPDQVSDIDFDFAAKTVAITTYSAAIALSDAAPTAGNPATARACDPVAQTGCGEGKKCSIDGGGAGLFQPACKNTPSPAAAHGDACSRPGGIPGEDTCATGLFCTPWGLASGDPTPRWCRELCVSDADCPSGDRCHAFLGANPGDGVCVPGCDPFATEQCPANAHCIGERAATDRTAAFGCTPIGTSAEGETCSSRAANCAAGLMCATSTSDGVERCRKLCDTTHTCEGDKTCVTLPNPPSASPSLGTCQ